MLMVDQLTVCVGNYHVTAINYDVVRVIKKLIHPESKAWKLLLSAFCVLLFRDKVQKLIVLALN